MNQRIIFGACAVFLVIILCGGPVVAEDPLELQWMLDTHPDAWTNPDNWQIVGPPGPPSVPRPNDIAYIHNTGTAQINTGDIAECDVLLLGVGLPEIPGEPPPPPPQPGSLEIFDGSFAANEVTVGGDATGTIMQSGGTSTISGDMMTGSGTDNASSISLTGGTMTVDGALSVGDQNSASFTLEKTGITPTLQTSHTIIGLGGVSGFTQTDGLHHPAFLAVESGSTYTFKGGELKPGYSGGGGLHVAGTLDFDSAPETVYVYDNSITNLADATVTNATNSTLTVGSGLLIYSAGNHPSSLFGTFTNRVGIGLIEHQVGATLVLDNTQGFTGSGRIPDKLETHAGNVQAPTGGFIDLQAGLNMVNSGTVNLGGGKLTVPDSDTSTLSHGSSQAGHFIAQKVEVQKGGTLVIDLDTAGTVTVEDMNVAGTMNHNYSQADYAFLNVSGEDANTTALYRQDWGAAVGSGEVNIGSMGPGPATYNHVQGVHTITEALNIGHRADFESEGESGNGTYILESSATLTMTRDGAGIKIGGGGCGAFDEMPEVPGGTGLLQMKGGTINETGSGAGVDLTVFAPGGIESPYFNGSGTIEGYGTIGLTGKLTNNYKVIAKAPDNTKYLNLSSFTNVSADREHAGGWYCDGYSALKLPAMSVPTGDNLLWWGDDMGVDTNGMLDMENSLAFDFSNVTAAGVLDITLYGDSHTDVPTIPDDFTLIGLWLIDSDAGMTFDSVDMTIRYEKGIANSLGLAAEDLCVFHYKNGQWKDVTTGVADHVNGLIHADGLTDFSFYAVGVPEPATLALIGAGGIAVLLKRRRQSV